MDCRHLKHLKSLPVAAVSGHSLAQWKQKTVETISSSSVTLLSYPTQFPVPVPWLQVGVCCSSGCDRHESGSSLCSKRNCVEWATVVVSGCFPGRLQPLKEVGRLCGVGVGWPQINGYVFWCSLTIRLQELWTFCFIYLRLSKHHLEKLSASST